MTDVFVSYSQKDRSFVRDLVGVLERAGYDVWWDSTLVPGDRYEAVILEKLNTAGCVIVVWTEDSLRSDWVKDEAQLAKDLDKLVPIAVGGVSPPMGFRQIQTARLDSAQAGPQDPAVQQLLSTIARFRRSESSGLRYFLMPTPEGERQSQIQRWLINEGVIVTENQPIMQIASRGRVFNVGAPFPGRIVKIMRSASAEDIREGQPIAIVAHESA